MDPQRTERMFAMRREGRTLQEIGDEFGVTRERVRQILVKTNRAEADRLTAERRERRTQGAR